MSKATAGVGKDPLVLSVLFTVRATSNIAVTS